MAAKPPKPPATFLKQNIHNNSDNQVNNNNDPNSSSAFAAPTTPTTPTSTATNPPPVAETFSKLGIRRYNSRDNLLNNINNDNYNTDNGTDAAGNAIEGGAAARPTCNCTNISIMHLFHEMKQEFPTIPDPIVAQCVNENCHQRENCIQMLRNELALNPIPVQTYPAKVLQQHNINQPHNNHQQQKQLLQQRQNSPPKLSPAQTPAHPQPPQRHKNATPPKPATPLRPIRPAPVQPPSGTLQRKRTDANNSVVTPLTNCDSVELVQNNNSNNTGDLLKDVNIVQSPCNIHSNNNDANNSAGEFASQTCDMPSTATAPANTTTECSRSSEFIAALNKLAATPPPPALLAVTRPRARPNTLNLQASQQQFQRQQLNKQLQQHLQHRSQLQQQQQQSTAGAPEDLPQQKPIRKAPLPPIAPKPVFHNQHNNNNNNNSCGNSPQSQSGGSYSAESNLTSPISSCGESEISANVGLASQAFAFDRHNNNNNHITPTSATPTYQQQPSSPHKSPLRHRSVITVQPEPPYARDFLPPSKIGTSAVATSATGGSGGSTPTSQKSFTSVNLTLRQPTAAVPQSTIDISAGPALSGNGSGLTYSSTSYDARRGYQQNFHITVTDEGGVFNASRIRPRNNSYYAGVEDHDSPRGPAGGVRQAVSATQQRQPPTTVVSPTTHTTHMLADNITPSTIQTTSPTSEEMCLPLENSVFTETIKRQKTRRDKLATALRENKNKLGHVEEEINMLTESLNPGESERLDYEINRLRSDCQQMLNEIENIRRYGQLTESERLQAQQQQQQQQQQSFPRQRPPRPPPPQLQNAYQYQQPASDPLPHHNNTAGSGGSIGGGVGSSHTSAASTPNSTYLQPPLSNVYHQHRPDYANQPPPYQPPPYQPPSTDEEEYSDSNTDGGEDDEPLERWDCPMCTFLNHPQLNICEACEYVRILPGTVRIVPTAGATAAAPPHPPATFIGATSATTAAAAAALAAAAPAAIAHGSGGAGAAGDNARSPATTAAARTVAAE
ncbi:dual specificity protein kinase splA isoform X1 [Anastrepha ludens]|uniref:dual specificity protein kinase splA isoform X1 n=1 Tax=Anastrepha ludens TaxID=28586 RepID=UPI0023AF40BA|nr:dual specificity protein kinase splA isoform X1 [Anastrepha ludens]XP_053964523.1 dual specificity protein kinase splA isoform X1 [Anastrepha ludens]